jgi:hypothetical protein
MSANGMVRPCSCPASDKLARDAKTRSTPCLRQHKLRLRTAGSSSRGAFLDTQVTSGYTRSSLLTFYLQPGSNQVPYRDLREFIAEVEALGALRRIDGADSRFEIGGITEVAAGLPDCPALLFDSIKGFARGFRVFTNATTNAQRAALALNIDPHLSPLDALKAWMDSRQRLKPHKPVLVTEAPFLENSFTADNVDLTRLPAPYWHRQDGGPYIGSGSIVIMRDPDGGWINASIYRVQVHSKTKVTIQFDHLGRHGAIIAKKYWDNGESCPVAVVNGEDPALFIAGFEYLPAGQSEYDFAGAIKGGPIEVLAGRCRPAPKSSSKGTCCRQARKRCRKAHSASSRAIMRRRSGRARSWR